MIEFESVSKTFRNGTTAVDNLSLVVPSGKVTVIVGPPGCGKTAALRMVNRMLEPSKGKISWDGKPLKSRRKTALRRQMGYVISSGGLFPHRTVLENVATVPGLLGWDRAKSNKRAVELLGVVGLERPVGSRYPAQLSEGQQQRVGLARALAADPPVLLLDEPFSTVDPAVRSELQDLFLGLQRQFGKTVVFTTQDIDEAIRLGDQIAVLRPGGRLAQVGAPQHLLDEPADAFVEGFVGKDRGYRALSFQPASGLPLGSVQVVRDAGYGGGNGPTLVVDADARPVSWAHPSRPGSTIALGATFDPERDSLRSALDAALTSPVGLAVAVTGPQRRYAGVVNADMILAHVTRTRAQVAESIGVRTEAPAVGAEVPAVRAEDTAAPIEDTAVRTGDPVPAAYYAPSAPTAPADWDEDPEVTSVRGVPAVGTVPPVAAVAPVPPASTVAAEDDSDATRISGPLPADIDSTPTEDVAATDEVAPIEEFAPTGEFAPTEGVGAGDVVVEDVPVAEAPQSDQDQPGWDQSDQNQPADSDDHDSEPPR